MEDQRADEPGCAIYWSRGTVEKRQPAPGSDRSYILRMSNGWCKKSFLILSTYLFCAQTMFRTCSSPTWIECALKNIARSSLSAITALSTNKHPITFVSLDALALSELPCLWVDDVKKAYQVPEYWSAAHCDVPGYCWMKKDETIPSHTETM